LQKNEGIDAVIVDSVLQVRRGLQAPGHDGPVGVNGAAVIVPEDSVPTIKEVTEVSQDGVSGKEAAKESSS
jgi:glycerophosphodiester phosphodiesterase